MGECPEWIPMVLRWSKHFPPRELSRAKSHAEGQGIMGCLSMMATVGARDTAPLSQHTVTNREPIQSQPFSNQCSFQQHEA